MNEEQSGKSFSAPSKSLMRTAFPFSETCMMEFGSAPSTKKPSSVALASRTFLDGSEIGCELLEDAPVELMIVIPLASADRTKENGRAFSLADDRSKVCDKNTMYDCNEVCERTS